MKKRYRIPGQLIVWISLLAGLLLSGCGYSMHRQGDLPFTEIQIRPVENRSLEPKLQDKLYAALVEEFEKNGIRVNPASGTKLSAVIHTFDMVILSEREEITIEYQVVMAADFIVEYQDGKQREIRNAGSPFIVSFASSEDLGTLLAKKELAEEKASRDVAMRIVGALIYK
ncbi:MAG: LPS assembly lipoprotein LptE [Nitrospirota bacterium]|nr:LPS assembly lipoprotein LptE [Nitrospirota bacterium]